MAAAAPGRRSRSSFPYPRPRKCACACRPLLSVPSPSPLGPCPHDPCHAPPHCGALAVEGNLFSLGAQPGVPFPSLFLFPPCVTCQASASTGLLLAAAFDFQVPACFGGTWSNTKTCEGNQGAIDRQASPEIKASSSFGLALAFLPWRRHTPSLHIVGASAPAMVSPAYQKEPISSCKKGHVHMELKARARLCLLYFISMLALLVRDQAIISYASTL